MARAGDVIGGKYRLIHPLGIGGMGAVWRAEHLALKQQVAVKLLDARGPAADRAVKRFQREAQIAASIRHRNIVYISDFGTDGGAPYLIMELLVGVPLSERIVVGEPLSVGTFLRLVEETLQGLAAVHAAGVVHRDMKPENIFLVREADGTVFPKLLDFGVSRSTERNAGHTITREGIVMGTPEYVSPEQARGRMADVRSDIYSLGVVVYEALAGRLPFQADNPADLIVAVLNADPIPLQSLRPDLGPRMSALVSKAMARNPGDRFQNTEEMRMAILSALEAAPNVEDLLLPRRFIAPSTQPTNSQNGDDRRNSGDLLPTQEESLPPRSTAGSPVFLGHSQRKLTAVALGGVAAVIALVALAFASGGEPTAASRAAAADATKPAASAAQQAPKVAAAPLAAPPSEVVVELFGVPPDAKVLADGQPADGTTLRFARGSGTHEIAVQALGKETWRISHDATRDGRYALALDPVESGKRSSRTRESSGEPGKSRNTGKKKPGLLRTPDF